MGTVSNNPARLWLETGNDAAPSLGKLPRSAPRWTRSPRQRFEQSYCLEFPSSNPDSDSRQHQTVRKRKFELKRESRMLPVLPSKSAPLCASPIPRTIVGSRQGFGPSPEISACRIRQFEARNLANVNIGRKFQVRIFSLSAQLRAERFRC
jgi:hypothetical protein